MNTKYFYRLRRLRRTICFMLMSAMLLSEVTQEIGMITAYAQEIEEPAGDDNIGSPQDEAEQPEAETPADENTPEPGEPNPESETPGPEAGDPSADDGSFIVHTAEHQIHYTSLGNDTHAAICTTAGCDYSAHTDTCTFVNGKCSICGATQQGTSLEEDHTHSFVYKSNGDGTHKVTCIVKGCKYSEVEECDDTATGICTKCFGMSDMQAGKSIAPGSFKIKVNDKEYVSFNSSFTIHYGDTISFSTPIAGTVEYKWVKKSVYDADDTVAWNTFTNDQLQFCDLNGIDTYYIGYDSDEDSEFGTSYVLKIEKAQIESPTLTWHMDGEVNSGTSEFTTPTKSASGGTLKPGTVKDNYTIRLYKDDFTASGKVHETSTKLTAGTTSYSLMDTIRKNGFGTYKYSIIIDSNNVNYNGTGELFSPAYVYKDTIQPTITAFAYDGSGDTPKLKASAKDDIYGSGIAAYAFTTVTDASAVSWTTIPDSDIKTKDTGVNFECEISSAGRYYFYVKDCEGNVTRSDDATYATATAGVTPKVVTKVTYNNTYSGGVQSAAYSSFYEGASTEIVIAKPERKGFGFTGWHVGSAEGEILVGTDAEAYSSITISGSADNPYKNLFATDIDLYAGWNDDKVSVSLKSVDATDDSTNTEREYNGKKITLSPVISGIDTGDSDFAITYQWYKDDAEIAGATKSSLDIINAGESGTYKLKVTIRVSGQDTIEKYSDGKSVTISKRNATVTAKNITISYGDDLPSTFTGSDFTYTNLADGDEARIEAGTGSVTIGSVVSVAGVDGEATVEAYSNTAENRSNVGTYFVKPQNFSSDNYNFTYETSQNLTVTPKDVEATGSGVDAALSQTSYEYDGTAHEPSITVADSVLGTTLTDDVEYNVSYPEAVAANDAARAVVTFKGNYKGAITKTYSIVKSAYTAQVQVNGWTYGAYTDTSNKPVITYNKEDIASIPDSKKHYYIAVGSGDSYGEFTEYALSKIASLNAGNYKLKVAIDSLDNYGATTTEPVDLVIKQRTLIYQSASGTWTYNGSSHVAASVVELSTYTDSETGITYTKDGFATGETYSSLTANTSITEVGSVTNTINIVFSPTTNSANYNVIKVEGTLTVTAQDLIPPTTFEWNTAKPGTASWVAVSRTGLEVTYQVKLFDKSGRQITASSNGTGDYAGCYTTTGTSYDFASIIKADSVEALNGYYFEIITVPTGGENGVNYQASEISAPSENIYTVKVNTAKSEGIATATINSAESQILIAGETASINATYEQGYKDDAPVWIASSTDDAGVTGITIADANEKSTSLTVKSSIEDSAVYTIVPHALDEKPVAVLSFDSDYSDVAGYKADMTRVKLGINLQDTKSLAAYTLAKFDSEEAFASGKAALEADTAKWIDISASQTQVAGGFTYTTTQTITEKGVYYLGVKDSAGQIVWTTPIKVYQIVFNANGGVGSMNPILKVDGYDISQLPREKYTKEGYGFTQWEEQTRKKVYVNNGMYTENADGVLVAMWSNKVYEYIVNYYYMDTTGNYPAAPNESITLKALIGTEINSTDDAIAKLQEGFTYDGEESTSGITIVEHEDPSVPSQYLNIYYERNKYTITYKYTDTDGSTKTLDEVEEHYYGEILNNSDEKEITIPNGYSFVGWNYDGSGTRPILMPADNINATGALVAELTPYYIHYLGASLDGTDFVVLGTETRTADHNTKITFEANDSESNEYYVAYDGFTIDKVCVVEGDGAPSYSDATASVEGTVKTEASEALNVYYFYTRNTYKLSINIYKGTRDNSDNKLYDAYWEYKYGEEIPSEVIEGLQTYYINVVRNGGSAPHVSAPVATVKNDTEIDVDGYSLAAYSDWSTGAAPATMPAGDVTVTRDYIENSSCPYELIVYFQDINGEYKEYGTPLIYYAPGGKNVELKNGSPVDGDTYNPYVNQLKTVVASIEYYNLNAEPDLSYDETLPASKIKGQVVNTAAEGGDDKLQLVAYFDRKTYKATVYYYYDTNTENKTIGNNPGPFAKEDIEGIWGSNTVKKTVTADGETSTEYTGFDPLKYFDNDGYTVDGKTYKDANCIVTYSGNYWIYGEGTHSRSYQFNSVASLSNHEYAYKSDGSNGDNTILFGQNDKTAIYVRYLPINDESFAAYVQYRPYGESEGSELDVLYNYNGADYKFRVVNQHDICNGTFSLEEDQDYTQYPGLAHLQSDNVSNIGHWVYDGTVKEGYTEITESIKAAAGADDSPIKTYYDGTTDANKNRFRYFTKNSDTENIIYIVPKGYERNYVGIRYGTHIDGSIPYNLMQKYVADYNADNDEQIRIYYKSFSGAKSTEWDEEGNVINPTNVRLLYTFYQEDNYKIYHVVDHNGCGGHDIGKGKKLTVADINSYINGCSYVTTAGTLWPGYELKFFEDVAGTKEIQPITSMNSHKYYYGIRVKDAIPYTKYIYYELPDKIGETSYIPSDQVEVSDFDNKVTIGGNEYLLIPEITYGEPYTVTGNKITPVITTYKLNGNIVLVKEEQKSESYQTISLQYGSYLMDGFAFDGSMSGNILNGHIEHNAINLRAYMRRNNVELTVDKNNSEDIITTVQKFGQTVKIADPTKKGYDFKSWALYKVEKDADRNTIETEITDGSITVTDIFMDAEETVPGKKLNMPNFNLKLMGVYDVADVDIPIIRYYKSNSKQYYESLLNTAQGITPSDVSVSFDKGDPVSAKAYYSDGALICISVTKGDYEEYYIASDVAGGITAYKSDIFAATKTITVKSETVLPFSDYYDGSERFTLESAICEKESGIVAKTAEVTEVAAEPDMVIEYYYARAGYLKTAYAAKSSDNTSLDETAKITVSGSTVAAEYGETITLNASVASGYDFIGWYDRDVIMSGDSVITAWNEAEKLCATATYSYKISEDMDIIALFSPQGILDPTVNASVFDEEKGNLTSYEYLYGYKAEDVKNIHASVVLAQNTSSAVYVDKYEWYQCDADGNEIGDPIGSASDYKISTNLQQKDYYYKCRITLARKDNAVTKSYDTNKVTISIKHVDLHAKATNYTGVYDGAQHGVTVALDKDNYKELDVLSAGDYTVYYSESPLTSENYSLASTEPITKKDVKVDGEGSVVAYDIYYYIQPNDLVNYMPTSGKATITITPKQLSIASADPFVKEFDGVKEVQGDLSTAGSDKYRLSMGETSGASTKSYYTVTGWISGEEESRTLDFNAVYNSEHVSKAGSVSLTDMKIVNKSNLQTDYNYKFASGAKLVISGSITPKNLSVIWSVADGDTGVKTESEGLTTVTYTFDGNDHQPSATVAEGLPTGSTVTVSGSLKNYGTQDAFASLTSTGEDANFDAADYRLTNSSCKIKIDRKPITVTTTGDTVSYDKLSHGLYKFVVNAGGEPINDVVSGGDISIGDKTFRMTATSVSYEGGTAHQLDTTFVNAGEYPFIPYDIKLYSSDNVNVTDNFEITTVSGTLKITPLAVTVNGIKAENKVFDTTTNATIDCSGPITYTGILEGDSLKLDASKITGAFADPAVGNNKTVNIEIQDGALLDEATGAVSKNYVLLKADGETVQKTTATANITSSAIKLKPNDISITYGDDVPFNANVTSTLNENIGDIDVWGSMTFTVKDNNDAAKSYTYTYTIEENGKIKLDKLSDTDAATIGKALFNDLRLPVGSYTITLNADGLTSANYGFAGDSSATLTVAKKKLTVTEKDSVDPEKALSKVYDGTTTVSSELKNKIKANPADYFTLVGVIEGETVLIKDDFECTYDNKNVKGQAGGVGTVYDGAEHIVITNLSLTNDNYEFDSAVENIKVPATITPKALTLTPKNLEFVYGTSNSAVEDKFTNDGITAAGLAEGGSGAGAFKETLADVYTSINFYTTYNDERSQGYNSGDSTDVNRSVKYDGEGAITGYTICLENAVQKNANYAITYGTGLLKITPKTVYVYAKARAAVVDGDNKDVYVVNSSGNIVMAYGDDINKKYDTNGNWINPSFGSTNGEYGFAYGQTDESLELKDTDDVTYQITVKNVPTEIKHGATTSTQVAGIYDVMPIVDTLNATPGNYVYEGKIGMQVLINKKIIYFEGENIKLTSKVYDATSAVLENEIRFGANTDIEVTAAGKYSDSINDYDYSYLYGSGNVLVSSQVLESDIDALRNMHDTGIKMDLGIDKTYYANSAADTNDGKDVGENKLVNLTYSLSDYLNERYVLSDENPQKTATAAITRKELVITATATPNSVKYGESSPVFSNVYSGVDVSGNPDGGFAGSEDCSVLLPATGDDLKPQKDDGTVVTEGEYTQDATNTNLNFLTLYEAVSSKYAVVAEYDIYAFGYKRGENGNYNVTYKSGKINVEKAQLEKPNVTFSATNPGHVSFTKVDDIGDVVVASYTMKLYKGSGASATEITIPIPEGEASDYWNKVTPNTDYDLLETIRSNGAGEYYVEVKAIASEVNNSDKINVLDSDPGKSNDASLGKKSLYAANVIVKMADGTLDASGVTAAAVSRAKDETYTLDTIELKQKSSTATINSSASATSISGVFIAGEKGITFGYVGKGDIATGYDIDKITKSSDMLSLGTATDGLVETTRTYTNTFDVGTLTSADDLVISVGLKHVSVTINAVLSFTDGGKIATAEECPGTLEDKFKYNYSKGSEMKVTISVEQGDTVSTDKYDYTYTWYIQRSGSTATAFTATTADGTGAPVNSSGQPFVTSTGNVSTISFPLGSDNISNIGKTGTYSVYCSIRATRKDNCTYLDYKTNTKLGANGKFTITVTKADITVSNPVFDKTLPGTSIYGWAYGETRGVPSSTANQVDNTKTPVYYYSRSNVASGEWTDDSVPRGWSKTMITDANTEENPNWYVIAYLPSQANYDSCRSNPVAYRITRKQLDKVSEDSIALNIGAAAGADYGKLTWDASATVYENAGSASSTASESHSKVVPRYNVVIEHSATADGAYTEKSHYDNLSSTTYNIADLLTDTGYYKVTITAVPDSSSAQDKQNAYASETSVKMFHVGDLTVDGTLSKVYDARPVTLTADFGGATVTAYKWYRDGVALSNDDAGIISGGAAYAATHVDQSGTYYCVATIEGVDYVTVKRTVSITKKAITVKTSSTTGDDAKIYDGTALTNSGYTIEGIPTDDSGEEIDTYSLTSTGSQTAVGTSNNTYTSLVIKHPDSDANIVSKDYTVTDALGTLTVKARPIQLTAKSNDGVGSNPAKHVYNNTDYSLNAYDVTSPLGLADGQSIKSVTITGSIRNVGTETNVISNAVIVATINDVETDVTSNYDIEYVNGTLYVVQADASITIDAADARTMSKKYDNVAVNDPVDAAGAAANVATYNKVGDGDVSFKYFTYDGSSYTETTVADSGAAAQGGAPKYAGTYYVKAYTSETTNYKAAESDYVAFTISKRNINLKADDKTSVYGAALQTLTHNVVLTESSPDTLLDADKASLSVSYTCYETGDTPISSTSPIGTYTINVNYDADTNAAISKNYNVSTQTGIYTLTAASINVTASDVEKTYDDSYYGISLSADSNSVAAADNSKIVIYYSTTTALTVDNYLTDGTTTAPTFKNVKIETAGDGTESVGSYRVYYYVACPNYNPYAGSNAVKINKKSITITADSDESFIYDGTAHTKDSYTSANPLDATDAKKGLAGNDVIKSVTVTGSQNSVGSSSNVPSAAVIMDSNDASADDVTYNYDITYVNGTLAVGQADAALTIAGSMDKTYDATAVNNPTKDSGTAYYTQVGDGTVSFVYYTKSGDTYTETTVADSGAAAYGGAPKYAGDYYVKAFATTTTNYKAAESEYFAFTISKRAVTVTSASDTKVYDGNALTKHEKTEVGLATGDSIAATDINYTGTITDVAYTGDTVSDVDNTFDSVVIKNSVGVDVTSNYTVTSVYGKLKVTPRTLVVDDLTFNTNMEGNKVKYIGTLTGPSDISVDVDLATEGGSNRTKKLTSGTDYTITDDTATKKQTTATAVGTYTVEVVGKGNYCGVISKTYEIYDDGKVDVTGTWTFGGAVTPAVNGGIYCGGVDITITDANLKHVTISYTGGAVTDGVDEDVQDGTTQKQYHLAGSVEGTVYTVVGTDSSGNVNDTYTITVYSTHSFTDYTKSNDYDDCEVVYRADCDHNCGAKDYIIKPEATVHWNYSYSYTTNGGTQSGVVNIGERVVYAKVELYRDDVLVETKYVDCESTCGVSAGAAAATEGSASCIFDSGYSYKEEDGTTHNYKVVISPVNKKSATEYEDVRDYETTSAVYKHVEGAKADIEYVPHTFYVPWKVTLTNLPKDSDGNTVCPEYIYVKVLYASTPDSSDSGYNVVSQQAGDYTKAVKCPVTIDADGNAVAVGEYEVWKYIQGTKESYYHRIEVVAYELDGQVKDVSDKNLRSICDTDHVNHTIGYDEASDKATGVIRYVLGNMLPTLLFAMNDGTDKIHKVLYAGIDGGIISEEEIKAVSNPTRTGYNFLGWYTQAAGGDKVAGPIIIGSDCITVYAHWSEIPKEENKNSNNSNSSSSTYSVIWPTTTTIPIVMPTTTVQPSKNIKKALEDTIGNKTLDTGKDKDKQTKPDDKGSESDSSAMRVVVDNSNRNVPTKDDDPELYDLLSSIDDAVGDGKKANFKAYLDLKLEKEIDADKWERILNSGEPIDVVIDIPNEFIDDNTYDLYVALKQGDKYILLEDLDDDPRTITIRTSDFDGEYVLISVDKENGPQSYIFNTDDKCYWHWLILLILLVELGAIILIKRKKEEDEDDAAGVDAAGDSAGDAAGADAANDEQSNKRKKIRIAIVSIGNVASLIIAIIGFCKYDYIFLAGEAVISILAEIIKERKSNDNQQEEK